MWLHAAVVAMAALVWGVEVAAQSDPWYGRSANQKDFVPAVMPWNSLALDLPKKDWQMVPGRGGILFVAAEKTRNNRPGGAIVLEQRKLALPLADEDINQELAGLEANETLTADPASTAVSHEVKEIDGRKFILVIYTRPGFAGTDTVVQYSFWFGDVKFRVIGVAPTAQLARYQPIFAHVAATFRDNGLARP